MTKNGNGNKAQDFRFETLALHAGYSPDPSPGARCPHLSDNLVPVPRHRPRGGAIQPARAGNIYPYHEPDQ